MMCVPALTAAPKLYCGGISKLPCRANSPEYLAKSCIFMTLRHAAPTVSQDVSCPWYPTRTPAPKDCDQPLLVKSCGFDESAANAPRPYALNSCQAMIGATPNVCR